jgi:hypothetical protein
LLIPPPAEAEVTVAQLVPPLELDEEFDEHPAASSADAATPVRIKRYADLTKCLLFGFPHFEQADGTQKTPGAVRLRRPARPPCEQFPAKP